MIDEWVVHSGNRAKGKKKVPEWADAAFLKQYNRRDAELLDAEGNQVSSGKITIDRNKAYVNNFEVSPGDMLRIGRSLYRYRRKL